MKDKDQEVQKEAEKIKTILNADESGSEAQEKDEYPLIVSGLSKIYDGADPTEAEKKIRKKALNNFSIKLDKNEIFGLLG